MTAALTSYACIHVFLACVVLRRAHRTGSWLERASDLDGGAFRVSAQRIVVTSWRFPTDALVGTTAAVFLGVAGLWAAGLAVEDLRFGAVVERAIGPRSAVSPVLLVIAVALGANVIAAERLARGCARAADHACFVGLCGVLGGVALAPGCWMFEVPWDWRPDFAWCRWVLWALDLALLGGGAALARAGSSAEGAELLATTDGRP